MTRAPADPAVLWAGFEQLAARVAHGADPEAMRRIVRVPATTADDAREIAERLQRLYARALDPDENMDAAQHAIAIAHGFYLTWMAVDDDGGDVRAALQAQVLDAGDGSRLVAVWYVAADPRVRAPVRELFARSLADLLADARRTGRAVDAIVGEARPGVERTFNRYGLRRPYYEIGRGELAEVPYDVPTDELDGVVAEHLQVILLDGRRELPGTELLAIVDALHREYLRPEYYTLEALRLSEHCRPAALPLGAAADEAGAAAYRRAYAEALAGLRRSASDALGAPEARVVLLSARERAAERLRGIVVNEVGAERPPLSA